MSSDGEELLEDAVFAALLEESTLGSPAARHIRSLTPPEVLAVAERFRGFMPEVDEAIGAITPEQIQARLARVLAQQGYAVPDETGPGPA